MRFIDTNRYDTMVDTTVNHYVVFSRYSDVIEGGTPLWRLRLFASENADASGSQRELSAQLLDETQMEVGASPGIQVLFRGGERLVPR